MSIQENQMKLDIDPEVAQLHDNISSSESLSYKRFIDYDSRYGSSAIYYFIEGKDNFYYDPIIKQITGKEAHYICCKCKSGVIKTHNIICSQNVYSSHSLMFFIDADYDDNSHISQDYYITDCYSIENYYCSKEVLRKILNKYCNIDPILDADTYNNIMEDFITWQSKFFEGARFYCAFFKCVKDSEKKKEMKWKDDIPGITYDNNEIYYKHMTLEDLNHLFQDMVTISAEQHNRAISEIHSISHIRGKNVLLFMKHYLHHLKTGKKDSKKLLRINPSSLNPMNNDLLVHIADCADVPQRLIDYIKYRYNKSALSTFSYSSCP